MSKYVLFWDWFAANATKFVGSNLDRLLVEELDHRIKTLGLRAWELGPDLDSDGARNYLCISSNGDANKEQTINQLLCAAPQVPGWRITQYRQRKEWQGLVQFRLEGETIEIDCTKWKFSFSKTKQGMILDICFPPETWTSKVEPRRAAFVCIMNEIGEEDYEGYFVDFDVEEWSECESNPLFMAFFEFRIYWKSIRDGAQLN